MHSHFGGEFFRDEEGKVQLKSFELGRPLVNYPAFLRAMKEIGYHGYFCFEFCHPAVDEKHNPAGIETIHEQTAMALEYMRDRIAEV